MIYLEQLPSRWKIVTLGSLSSLIQYGLNVSSERSSDEFLYLRISDINDEGEVNLINPKYLPKNIPGISRYILEPGDIVIARSGASRGRGFVYQ